MSQSYILQVLHILLQLYLRVDILHCVGNTYTTASFHLERKCSPISFTLPLIIGNICIKSEVRSCIWHIFQRHRFWLFFYDVPILFLNCSNGMLFFVFNIFRRPHNFSIMSITLICLLTEIWRSYRITIIRHISPVDPELLSISEHPTVHPQFLKGFVLVSL